MKKIKLFLAAMAAMVSLGAQAGSDWVAPSAPSATDPVSGSTYKIRNVGAGQYLTGGSAWFGWATSAVLGDVNSAHEWTLTGSESAGYTFACNRSGNNKLFTSGNDNAEQCMHVDGGSATTYFLEKQSSGYYRLRQNGITGKYVGGPDNKGGILAQIEDTEKYGTNSCDWEFVPLSALTTYGPTITYAEVRAKVLAYVNATDIYTDQNNAANTLLNGVYAQDDVVDAATTAAEVNSATEAIKALVLPFVSAVKINDGKSFDITDFALTNPGFELGNMNGWTQEGTQSLGAQGNKAYDNTKGNYYAEKWHADGTIILRQTTSTLPAGYYELKAYLMNGGTSAGTLAANEASTSFQANGQYGLMVKLDNEGTLAISASGAVTGSTWFCVDGFTLTYLGTTPLALFQSQLAEAVAAANSHADAIAIPADALTAYKSAISTAAANNTTVDACLASIDAIEQATATADALVSNSARYNTVKTAAKKIATSLDTTTPDAAFDAATTNDAVEAAIASLRAAFLAELPNVTIHTDPGYIDVTAVMVDNASVSQNTEFWITEKQSGNGPTTNYGETEFYNANFKFYQTLALTPGTWEFGVTGFHRGGQGDFSTYFYAGEDKILIPGVESSVVNTMAEAQNYFNGGNGKVALKFLIETAGDVEIGIDNQDTQTDKWTIFRDFTLKYYGAPDYSVYTARLAELANEAATVDGTVPTAAYTALNNVVTTNNTTHANKAEYIAAIEAVENAIATAKALQGAYEEYNTVKAQVVAMKSVEGYAETTSGATSTLTSDIATVDEAVAAATTADAIANQITALRAAGKAFLVGVRSDGEHAFDITFLITNPGFDNNNTDGWEKTFTPNDQWSGLNTRIQCNEFYQSTFDFYQTLTGMPKGNYELKVQAFQRPGFAADVYPGYLAGTSKATSVIYINGGETTINHFGAGVIDNVFGHTLNGGNLSDLGAGYDVVILDNNGTTMYGPQMMETAALWFSQGYYDNTVLTAVDGDLKLGFKSTAAAAGGDWTIFDNFRLYYYGQSINVAMDEAVAFSALADIEGANVTMVRNGKASYNTVALPFDLTEAQVKAVFGDGVEVYSFSDEGDANNTTVNFNTAATAIQANVPVLVKATQASTQIEVDNVTVKAGEAKVEGNNYDFVGNYGGPVTIAEGDYFISGDKLYKSTGATTIKGFRAYLKDKTGGQSNVKMYIDGLETSISEINGEGVENGVIYNLAGQRVNKAQKGIYIQNGKKVLVK